MLVAFGTLLLLTVTIGLFVATLRLGRTPPPGP